MDSERGQPRLDIDTLRLICYSLTDISDVLSFALTSLALKNDAFQRRLEVSPVVLSNAEALDRFHDFIFADVAARAPHIRGLKLPRALPDPNNTESNNAPSQTPKDCLVAVLECAITLEYLSLPISSLVDLLPIVAKISTLRELFAWGRYSINPFLKLLATLCSPLQHPHIDWEWSFPGGLTADFLHNSLAHFTPTLKILELPDFALDVSPSSLTTPFPAMRSLKANLVYSFESLDGLLRLFPNLNDTLVVHSLHSTSTNHPAFREQSKEAQKTHTWRGLDHIVFTVQAAFLLALQCPIRRMDIERYIVSPEERQHLAEVLHDNCPRQLSVWFRNLQVLDDLFPVEAATNLTHLVLFFSVTVELREGCDAENNFPWAQFIDTLIHSMKHFRLTHLRIVLEYVVFCGESVLPTPAGVLERDHSVYYAREEELYPAATRLFAAIPTLKYLLMTTCGYTFHCERTPESYEHTFKWLSSKAWRLPDIYADLRPSGTEFVEIRNEEAEVVIGREELHLEKAAQVGVLTDAVPVVFRVTSLPKTGLSKVCAGSSFPTLDFRGRTKQASENSM